MVLVIASNIKNERSEDEERSMIRRDEEEGTKRTCRRLRAKKLRSPKRASVIRCIVEFIVLSYLLYIL